MMAISRRGVMLILSSPSGAGKTSIARAILQQDPNVVNSISVTTRPRRSSEAEGVHYHFVSEQEFVARINAGDFLEHVQVFGNRYGTPRTAVEAALSAGKDVLFDIDWQGMQKLTHLCPEDVVSVFVLPPSFEELAKRLRTRSQDDEGSIRRRLAEAALEMSHWPEYDFVIVNDDLSESISAVQAILTCERQKRHRQTNLPEFIHSLRQSGLALASPQEQGA